MDTSAEGLRVLSKRNPYFSGDPQIVVFKLDAETATFLEVHGNAEQLLGFSSNNWLEPGFWPPRIHPDDRDAALKFCVRCTEQRQDHELEYRVIHADGSVVWIHEIVEFNPDDPEGAVASGYIMNITHRVQHESDVRKALGLKEELFRVVVEDLNQPVRKIANFGDMLMRHLSAQGDDVGSDYAIGLREGLQELGALIDGLQRAGRDEGASYEELSERLASLSGRMSERR